MAIRSLFFDFGGCIDAPGIHTRTLFWDAFRAAGLMPADQREVFQEAYTAADQRMMETGEAKAMGLVNRIAEGDDFLAEVMAFAREFVPPRRASRSVGLIKRAVISGLEMGFAEGLSLERELQQRLFVSEDAAEGIRAYNEKRTPQFQGK